MSNRTSSDVEVFAAAYAHGVFRTLTAQHAAISDLFDRLRAADNPAVLWPVLRVELLSHERGETREVYPLLRTSGQTRAAADLHDADARYLEDMIVELDSIAMDAPDWLELFNDLALEVQAHARDEEQDLFPRAQLVLGREVAEQLDASFLRANRQLLESL